MEIERFSVISDPQLIEQLWDFYHKMFDPINERTPLSQTLDRGMFSVWMESTDALKLIVRDNCIKAFAILSSDLSHDPLISQAFFAKKYPGRQVRHIPVICICKQFRRDHPMLCAEMVQTMRDEVREAQALSIFFHSRSANPAMPRLIGRACGKEITVHEEDAMACVFLEWTSRAN